MKSQNPGKSQGKAWSVFWVDGVNLIIGNIGWIKKRLGVFDLIGSRMARQKKPIGNKLVVRS
jgi:hypothetical protein